MDKFSSFFKYYYNIKGTGGVENYSIQHLIWFTTALAIIVLTVYIYRILSLKIKRKVICTFAIASVAIYFFKVFWALSIGKFRPDSMLPFHLCGIMVFIEFVAVMNNNTLFKEIAYTAGLPGAFIALLTPDINGYPFFSFQFQVYIISHMILMTIPLLLVYGDEYRPNREYLTRVYGFLCTLAAFDGVVNKLLNSNYLFVSKAPSGTPFIYIEKLFGYWGYLSFLIIGSFLALNLMYLLYDSKIKKVLNRETILEVKN